MRTHNIPSSHRKSEILIMPPDLALLSTPTGSNYPCLELIFMVPKVFEPMKFDCITLELVQNVKITSGLVALEMMPGVCVIPANLVGIFSDTCNTNIIGSDSQSWI